MIVYFFNPHAALSPEPAPLHRSQAVTQDKMDDTMTKEQQGTLMFSLV